MKVILEFNLPEEDNEFKLAVRGSEWANTLYLIDKQLRDWLKYELPPTFRSAETIRALEDVRDRIQEEMQDANLTFDDLN